jgi:aldehyde dehydrogenase (NAD+)
MTQDPEFDRAMERVTAWLRAEKQLLIGGAWVPAVSGERVAAVNPADGSTLAHVARGGEADIDAAVAAARAAFDGGPWRRATPRDRQRLISRFAALVDEHYHELAILESLDLGVAYARSFGKRNRTVSHLDFYAAVAGGRNAGTRVEASTMPGRFGVVVEQPVGVVGAITPWNSPVMSALWKIGPVLATGCTMVLKPAEEAPLVALRLGELLVEAGLPDGVVNIVNGRGSIAGAALAAHPGVNKVAFTGSTDTAKSIITATTHNFARLSLELGGKSPNIVFADADLAAAAKGAIAAGFTNSGQICTAGTRLFVQHDVYDDFLAELRQQASRLTVGPGLEPGVDVGPLVSRRQQERVQGFLARAAAQGAEAVVGGGEVDPRLQSGCFIMPTVLGSITDDMEVYSEEVFGPVVVARPFADTDQVISMANDSRYGLAGGIWSRDIDTVNRVSFEVDAGIFWVNGYGLMDPAFPFGGTKHSGYGREGGLVQLEDYLTTKTIVHGTDL